MAKDNNTVVARIGLDDRGFQEGVSKIQRGLKVVQSEFAAASSKLGDFGKSTEGLKLKSDSLNKQIELQKDKISALNKSYMEGVEKKGEDTKATENLKIKLNYAAVEMNKLQRELKETNEKIKIQESRWTQLLYQSISAGVESGKSIEFLGSAVKLAKGGFTETTSSVDLLTTILNGYKLKAEETANVSDILINTQNLGKTSVNELSSSMGKVVPIASAANVSLKQLSSAYVLLTQKGIATAEVGTYTRSMLSELSKTGSMADKTLRQISGKSFAELMESGKSVGNVLNMLNDYAVKNNLTLKDMFGSVEAGTASMILASSGGEEFNKVLETMSNVAGATDTAFNNLKNAGIQLGDSLTPVIETVSELVQLLAERLNKLTLAQADVVVKIGLIVTAIGQAISIIGKLISTCGTLYSTLGSISTALGKAGISSAVLGKAFTALTGPVGIIIGVIAGLIAIFTVLYKNNEDFRNIVNSTWNEAKAIISRVIESLKIMFQAFASLANSIWSKYGDDIVKITSDAFNLISNIVKTVLNVIKDLMKIITSAIKGDWQNVWEGIKNLTSDAWNGIKNIIKTVIDLVKSIIKAELDFIKGIVSGVWNAIKSAIETPINAAKNTVKNAIDAIKNFFANLKIPEIKIPHIKLPHFNIDGEFNLSPPSVPHLDVNWYASGGIFNRPSIIGVGEAGTEAVLPIEKLDELIAKEIGKVKDKNEAGGITLQIENFINNTDKDIEQLAYELEFYRQKVSLGRGNS